MFYKNDYLTQNTKSSEDYRARIIEENGEIVLTNGIAERRFVTSPDLACVSIKNLYSGEQFLRAVKPEVTVTIDGKKYPVGGVSGQFEFGFLKPKWLAGFMPSEGFNHKIHREIPLSRSFSWKRKRRASADEWPPKGVCLEVTFDSKLPELEGIEIIIRYECYDGIPAFGKSFSVINNSKKNIRLNEFEAEILAITEHDMGNTEAFRVDRQARNVFAVSDIENNVTPTFTYTLDEEYTSQVDYMSQYPILLVSKPPLGPHKLIKSGERFDSYNAHILLFDETDRMRRMLQIDRLYTLLAPWTTENPIYLHVVSDDPDELKAAADQCAEAGFEMIIVSFGSGLDMEDVSEENIAKFKAIADYAHSKGIELGGYSLLASRHIDEENDVIADHIIFGDSPCLGSEWGIRYLNNIRRFIVETGFDELEHDGSYPGDVCHSEKHPGHECYEDSQYTQLTAITDLYKWCRERGVYLTVPDYYYLAGNNKCAMGYKEVNWSLPREQQEILARQNIYDGTYCKLPSMGWMFVPLTEYHGGGAAATIEPLCEHIDHYRLMLNNNLMAGVQASYRGKRLYDTEETKSMVKESIDIYKAHRDIFESPAVHIRRPDGRDYDGYVHVNPALEEKGMIVFFNPLDEDITRTVSVPLYYTGLTDSAVVSRFGKDPVKYDLNRDYTVDLTFTVPANDYVWFTVK